MSRIHSTTAHGTVVALGLAGLMLTAPALAAGPVVPLGPGVLTGFVNHQTVKPGDTLAELAAFHGVHPIRITRPSAGVMKGGLTKGEEIFIDQRRVQPSFAPWVSGIVLNVPEAQVYLVEKGKLIKEYPVAVSDPDWKAPIGQFKVLAKHKNPAWHVPPKIQAEMARNGQQVKTIVPAGPKNPLGPRWIGFADGTFGFHGTTAPTSIKSYTSHGCVRFMNKDITDLFERVKVGMPVRVYYQPVKVAVVKDSIWLTAYPDIYKRGVDYRAQTRTLLATAGVSQRVDWKQIEKTLTIKDGILMDVALKKATPAAVPVTKTSN